MPNIITLPDGLEIEIPDDATPDQLTALKTKLAAQYPTVKPETSADRLRQTLSDTGQGAASFFGMGDNIQGAGAALAVGADKLMGGDGGGLGMLDAYDQASQQVRDEQDVSKERSPLAYFAGDLASSLATGAGAAKVASRILPGSASSALLRYASTDPIKAASIVGAGQGMLTGAAEADNPDDSRIVGGILGGAIGAAGGAVGGAAAKGINRAWNGVANAVDNGANRIGGILDDGLDTGNLGNAENLGGGTLRAEARAPRTTPQPVSPDTVSTLTPDQLARKEALAAAGVTQPTAAMLTRDPKLWQYERNTAGISGLGDDIKQRYIDSNAAIKGALSNLQKSTGGTASTPYEAGLGIVEAVNNKRNSMQSQIGKLYTRIRETRGDDIGLKPSGILATLDDVSDNAYGDKIVTSMQNKMRRYGVLDKSNQPIEGATLTVKNAEELRKFANTLRGDYQTDGMVERVIDSLDDDVINTTGDDAFKTARDAARKRFQEFESRSLKGISEGKIVSDDVMKKAVYSSKIDDLVKFKASLTTGTKKQIESGTGAWNDIRHQVMQKLMGDSTDFGGQLYGTRLTKALNNLGKERLNILFSPEEITKLRQIEKAAEYTTVEVPQSFVNYSGTAAAQANNALGGILGDLKSGSWTQAVGEGMSSIPLVGGPLSLVGAPIAAGGRLMNSAAQKRVAKSALNPEGVLKSAVNPNVALIGGILGDSSYNNNPFKRKGK